MGDFVSFKDSLDEFDFSDTQKNTKKDFKNVMNKIGDIKNIFNNVQSIVDQDRFDKTCDVLKSKGIDQAEEWKRKKTKKLKLMTSNKKRRTKIRKIRIRRGKIDKT